MGASDYMVDPQERGFGPPNMAAQLFGMISSLPNAYQEGVEQKFKRGQMARTEELQKPVNLEDGKLDYASLVQKYLQAKGTEAIPDVLPNAWKTQFLGSQPLTPSPYGPSNPNITPDNQTPAMLQPQGQRGEAQPPSAPTAEDWTKFSAAGPANEVLSDHRGPLNIRQLAADAGLDPNNEVLKNEFKGYGLDRSITRGTAPGIYNKFQNLKNSGAFGPVEPDATAALGRGQGTIYMPGPGMQAPQGAPPVQMAQAGSAVPSTAASMVPPGVDPRAYAQRLKQAAEGIRTQARREGIAGIPSKANEDKAAAYDKTADDILKAIAEEGKQRTQQRLDIGKSEVEETRKAERGRSEAMITKIDSANEKATEGRQRGEMLQSLTNAPDFNAGIGTHYIDILNGIGNRLFGLPNLGTSGQFFDKLRAGSILNSIKDLGGSGAGPVRVAEMKFINTVQAGRDMNPTSIRSALATEDRLHQRAQEIFNMKEDYLKTHKELGPDFNKKVSDYANKNEIFSEAELAHPELVGMPILRNEAQMRAANLPPGTPYRTGPGPNAKVKFTPGNAPVRMLFALPSDRT